jgi:hypothetical protein
MKNIIWVIILLIIVGGFAFAFIYKNREPYKGYESTSYEEVEHDDFSYEDDNFVRQRQSSGPSNLSNRQEQEDGSGPINVGSKTYVDNEYGFKVEYPSGWQYKDVSYNLDGVGFCPSNMENCGAMGGGGSINAPIIIQPSKYDMTGNVANVSDSFHPLKDREGRIMAVAILTNSKYEEEFEKMVSTFEFINRL